jgi:hypothetical protein
VSGGSTGRCFFTACFVVVKGSTVARFVVVVARFIVVVVKGATVARFIVVVKGATVAQAPR